MPTPNLTVAPRYASNARPTTSSRAIVRAAAAKVALKSGAAAKTAGRAVARLTVKGAGSAARGVARGSRAIGRAVKENWKTAALHEGVGLSSHVGTFFADRKAEQTYLKALEGIPLLRWLATPSNIISAAELLGVMLTKGRARAVLRELLRGTMHAKTGRALHAMFPDTTPNRAQARTSTKGVDDEDLSGAELPVDDEDRAG